MKRIVEKPTDKLLIEITLTLIDEHRGVRGVTLREITRKAGCKHTNVYNYFESFEELLWSSLAEVVNQNMEFTNQRMCECIEQEKLLIKFTESQIEFAASHPGLYQFMWVESLSGTPPAAVRKVIHSPYLHFFELMKKTIAIDICDREIQQIADIIHGYMHGEICKLINGRYFGKTKESYSQYIVENVIRIFSSLIPKNQNINGGQVK
ncbi:MAG: TetR/AcrR family transcriptional regulator [Clostridia bacterium]|nr:TetR/AcrR family transcriptional regulator [Clostridia bacterium]